MIVDEPDPGGKSLSRSQSGYCSTTYSSPTESKSRVLSVLCRKPRDGSNCLSMIRPEEYRTATISEWNSHQQPSRADGPHEEVTPSLCREARVHRANSLYGSLLWSSLVRGPRQASGFMICQHVLPQACTSRRSVWCPVPKLVKARRVAPTRQHQRLTKRPSAGSIAHVLECFQT